MRELTEKESVVLDGLGFEESKDKKGLFLKKMDNGDIAYWDFRSILGGRFYVGKADGSFQEDVLTKVMDEYRALRDVQEDKEFKTAKVKHMMVEKKQTKLERKDEAFTLMNIKDDEQVLKEIQGAFLDEFVYSFPTREGNVTGLSWAGVKEVARRKGDISIEDINITETPQTYRVLAKAKDTGKNVTMFGVAEQAKFMKLKTGESVEDMHALSKCVSRAQRNGIRTLIPEMIIKKMLEDYAK